MQPLPPRPRETSLYLASDPMAKAALVALAVLLVLNAAPALAEVRLPIALNTPLD